MGGKFLTFDCHLKFNTALYCSNRISTKSFTSSNNVPTIRGADLP